MTEIKWSELSTKVAIATAKPAIVSALREHPTGLRFAAIRREVGLRDAGRTRDGTSLMRVGDRALQELRKSGVIACTGTLWRVAGER